MFQSANDMATRFETELQMFRDGMDLGCQGPVFRRHRPPRGRWCWSLGGILGGRESERQKNRRHLPHPPERRLLRSCATVALYQSSAWRELMALPTIADRVAHMQKAGVGNTLVKEGIEAGDLKQLAQMLHPFGHGERPDLDFDRKCSLAQLAEALGQDPVEIYVDRLIASEGREYFNLWMFGGNLENQWNYMRLPHGADVRRRWRPRWLLHRHRFANRSFK